MTTTTTKTPPWWRHLVDWFRRKLGLKHRYTGHTLYFPGPDGEMQSRTIVEYDSSTKTATISGKWDAPGDDTSFQVMEDGP